MLNLADLHATLIDDRVKGIPGGTQPFPLSEISQKQWNVLREDLPLPLLVLKQTALHHNLHLMKSYLEERNLSFAPHGKTSMAPQLFEMQLSAGAWAITAATMNQVQVYRSFGIDRILLANQLLGPQHVAYAVRELNRDQGLDLYSMVDSIDGVMLLASLARQFNLRRPHKVLLEMGYPAGRTGCRSVVQARGILEALRSAQDVLSLVGLGGFEGLMMTGQPDEISAGVSSYLSFIGSFVGEIQPADMPGATEIILTAGGSAHFDLVADVFGSVECFLPKRIVLRSGCYLTHDSEMYEVFQEARARRGWTGKLRPALEVWSYVQSLPEPELAILSMGKRDCPFDYKLPLPQKLYRGTVEQPLPGCSIAALNDQHAYMKYQNGIPLKVGDKIVCGISHPCTAFDKWRFIPMVNDDYDVVDAVLTFF